MIAIHSRHGEIEHDRVNALAPSCGDTGGAIERNQNFVSIVLEEGPVKLWWISSCRRCREW